MNKPKIKSQIKDSKNKKNKNSTNSETDSKAEINKFKKNVAKLSLMIFAAVASYLFYFLMARMLTIEDYGLLYSLIALTYLFTVPHETIRTVIAKYTVDLAAKKEYGKIKGFFLKAVKTILIYSAIAFVIFLGLLPLLMNLLHAPIVPLIIVGSSLLVTFLLPIIWGLLQGLQSFGHLGLNNSIETAIKLIIAVVLVLIGLGINGALIAIPVSIAAAFFIGFWPLKKVMKAKAEPFKEKHIVRYSMAAFIIFLFFVAMYSVDTIAMRYFFSAKTSGLYGSISVIGKIVLFVSIVINRVMFSAVAEQRASKSKDKEKKARKLLMSAFFYVLAVTAFFLVISLFAPNTLIKIVVGSKYLEIASNLKYMIIAMGLLSLSSLIIFYNLSLDWNKKLTARILGVFLFLQIALFIVFHRTLQQFINIILIVNVLLFLALLATLLIRKK
ncbi:MAG: oligosaccharide flippase family protein [Candidatus Nanoarchaeia archaeon]